MKRPPGYGGRCYNAKIEQKITPWEVEGAVVDGETRGIDYDKLINQFGTRKITTETLERFKAVTEAEPHPFFEERCVFSERDLENLCLSMSTASLFLVHGRGTVRFHSFGSYVPLNSPDG